MLNINKNSHGAHLEYIYSSWWGLGVMGSFDLGPEASTHSVSRTHHIILAASQVPVTFFPYFIAFCSPDVIYIL